MSRWLPYWFGVLAFMLHVQVECWCREHAYSNMRIVSHTARILVQTPTTSVVLTFNYS
jgi:hypothetical protein